MIHNLTGKKDAERVLRNMVLGIDGISQVQQGDVIVYWTGDFSDEVGCKPVGREARRLGEFGRVRLVQRKVSDRMTDAGPIGVFEYMAVVR